VRARNDARAFCLSFWGLVLEVLLGGAGAAVGALLVADPQTPTRVKVMVGGASAVVGFFAVAIVAFGVFLLLAPVHQRNEARGELGRLTVPPASDPAAFVREFSSWLSAKRAALPDWPASGRRRGGLSVESPVYQAYDQTRREAHREARVEYHERFRRGVLALLGEEKTEQADNPQTIKDLDAVEQLLRETGQ